MPTPCHQPNLILDFKPHAVQLHRGDGVYAACPTPDRFPQPAQDAASAAHAFNAGDRVHARTPKTMNLEALVARQAQLWELKRRLEAERQLPTPPQVSGAVYRPCLLISRESGSGGDAIARLAGQRLGWHVYDREIVEQIADQSHLRQQLIETVDERSRSAWQTLRSALSHDGIDSGTYLHHLETVVRTLGHHGEVVIVGRGAHLILPPISTLRVRVVAPLPLRRERLMAERHLDSTTADAELRRVDGARDAFHRRTFGRDAESPAAYDVILNTESLTTEAAVEAILVLLKAKLGVIPSAAPTPSP